MSTSLSLISLSVFTTSIVLRRHVIRESLTSWRIAVWRRGRTPGPILTTRVTQWRRPELRASWIYCPSILTMCSILHWPWVESRHDDFKLWYSYLLVQKCQHHCFRAGNTAFRGPSRFLAFHWKCPAFLHISHWIDLAMYLFVLFCVLCLEFKAMSTQAPTYPGLWISLVTSNPPN